jgi:hypothetical protein
MGSAVKTARDMPSTVPVAGNFICCSIVLVLSA